MFKVILTKDKESFEKECEILRNEGFFLNSFNVFYVAEYDDFYFSILANK